MSSPIELFGVIYDGREKLLKVSPVPVVKETSDYYCLGEDSQTWGLNRLVPKEDAHLTGVSAARGYLEAVESSLRRTEERVTRLQRDMRAAQDLLSVETKEARKAEAKRLAALEASDE